MPLVDLVLARSTSHFLPKRGLVLLWNDTSRPRRGTFHEPSPSKRRTRPPQECHVWTSFCHIPRAISFQKEGKSSLEMTLLDLVVARSTSHFLPKRGLVLLRNDTSGPRLGPFHEPSPSKRRTRPPQGCHVWTSFCHIPRAISFKKEGTSSLEMTHLDLVVARSTSHFLPKGGRVLLRNESC